MPFKQKQKLIRKLIQQKNKILLKDFGEYNRTVNSYYGYRTQVFINLVEEDLLIYPDERYSSVDSLFSLIKVSPRVNQKDGLLLIYQNPIPNAICIGEGTFVVTTGLLATLENEEQLAWVLSHEFAHLTLDHANRLVHYEVQNLPVLTLRKFMDFMLQLFALKRQEIIMEYVYEMQRLAFTLGRHSRAFELEADSLGLLIYRDLGLQNDYESVNALNALENAFNHNPNYRIEHLFNFKAYPFKQHWLKERSSFFSEPFNHPLFPIDSIKSHPETAFRINKISHDYHLKANPGTGASLQTMGDYRLINLYSAYQNNNFDILLFLSAKYYGEGLFKKEIVNIVAASLLRLYKAKSEPEFQFLVSPFSYEYGQALRNVNNFLHNTRKQDLLKIGFLFLNDINHFDPKDESHFLLLWNYAETMGDFELMKEIRVSYKENHTKPKYLKEMR